MINPLVLTVDQVAELLQVDPKIVLRLRSQRKIAFVKIGGKLRFRIEDVQDYLRKATQPCRASDKIPSSNKKDDRYAGSIARMPNGSDDATIALAIAAQLKKGTTRS